MPIPEFSLQQLAHPNSFIPPAVPFDVMSRRLLLWRVAACTWHWTFSALVVAQYKRANHVH